MNYYNQIKEQLIEDEIYQKVKDYSKEQHRVKTYYEIGKLLSEAGKHYGDNIIGEYSKRLELEVNKKYSERNLRYIRKFYETFSNQKWKPLVSKLCWSHIVILLPLNDINKICYYIKQVEENNLSKRKLQEIIKNNEYERLPYKYKNKINNNNKLSIEDFIKDPIILNTNKEIISEKLLKQLILEDISSFMKQLGNGYSFIDAEYKILIDNRPNYIDILLFNYIYNCFVVIELKITEVKKEHIGQIQVYMNYINKNIKTIYMDNTIGIIIAKKKNEFVISYSSDNRIYETTYKIKEF